MYLRHYVNGYHQCLWIYVRSGRRTSHGWLLRMLLNENGF
ncbi:Uncharacterised protein [Mycobacteroides abscessus subsp. abscessus]|nr:Uncharacterised protein [Mycobacteroides abscessus subsp. abscessus]